jgi:hypothetical protein
LHSDGIDKQDEPEFPGKFHHFVVYGELEMAKGQAGEEHAGNPQAHTAQFETAKYQAGNGDEGEYYDRSGNGLPLE